MDQASWEWNKISKDLKITRIVKATGRWLTNNNRAEQMTDKQINRLREPNCYTNKSTDWPTRQTDQNNQLIDVNARVHFIQHNQNEQAAKTEKSIPFMCLGNGVN